MYTTLAMAKWQLKTSNNSDDPLLLGYIAKVTERIRKIAQVDLEPWYKTVYLTANPMQVNTGTGRLQLNDYLLQPDSIVSDKQNLVYGTDVLPDPQGQTPIEMLRLNDANGALWRGWYPLGIQFLDTIVITGWWGWRRYYNLQGWLPSNQTSLNPSTAVQSDQTITVTSVNAMYSLFRTPTFSPGNLIRIDNEMMVVYKTDPIANTLSVQRAANGSAIATHLAGASITIWEWEPDISAMAARHAAFFYTRRGAYEEVSVSEVARVVYPRDLLAELYNTLQGMAVI